MSFRPREQSFSATSKWPPCGSLQSLPESPGRWLRRQGSKVRSFLLQATFAQRCPHEHCSFLTTFLLSLLPGVSPTCTHSGGPPISSSSLHYPCQVIGANSTSTGLPSSGYSEGGGSPQLGHGVRRPLWLRRPAPPAGLRSGPAEHLLGFSWGRGSP